MLQLGQQPKDTLLGILVGIVSACLVAACETGTVTTPGPGDDRSEGDPVSADSASGDPAGGDEVTDADTGRVCSGSQCEPPGNTTRVCDGFAYVSAPSEVCWDHIDNNCDGAPDNGCANGNPVYVDPSDNVGPYQGTFDNPYNSWTQLTIAPGNDYRQKCGTTHDQAVAIDAAGTATTRILIGAYYDSGGTPTHEDVSPSFGRDCGNGAAKPNMHGGVRTSTEDHELEGSEQYIVFDSLRFEDPNPSVPIRIASQHNTMQFLYVLDAEWGIWLGRFSGEASHHFYVGHTYMDLGTALDEANSHCQGADDPWPCCAGAHPDPGNRCAESVDPIKLFGRADDGIIEHNVLTGYDHIGINAYGMENSIVQYNRCEQGTAMAEDYCINLPFGCHNNIVRHNYSQDAGYGIAIGVGSTNNKVFGNVMTCDNPTVPGDNLGACFVFANGDDGNLADNLVHNNTIYDADVGGDRIKGMAFYCSSSVVNSTMVNNRIHNNLFQKVDIGMMFSDACGSRDNSDLFYNNLIHDWDNTNQYYARFTPAGGTHNSATSLNGESFAQGNRDDDPILSDPANDQFWPLVGSPSIGNGYDTGEDYDDLIDPSSSDLQASPMRIFTVDWDDGDGPSIGAFARGN
ncbi:hypothetical protein ACFL6C_07925 [Myxococcota bacterium]